VDQHRLIDLMRTPCRLRFRPISELTAETGETEWLWNGYIAKGALTVLAGQPKVGKSTLAFGLFAQRALARPLLGLSVSGGQTLLLSEEREASLSEKANDLHVAEGLHILCRQDVRMLSWPEVIDDALLYCRAQSIDLLVVDTFDKWGGHDENHPGQVVEALQPLLLAAAEGLAVLILHHQRKAAGSYGEAVRGSNALTGGVDVVMELERAGSIRVLRSLSRFRSTPEEVFAHLCGDHFEHIELGDDEIAPYSSSMLN